MRQEPRAPIFQLSLDWEPQKPNRRKVNHKTEEEWDDRKSKGWQKKGIFPLKVNLQTKFLKHIGKIFLRKTGTKISNQEVKSAQANKSIKIIYRKREKRGDLLGGPVDKNLPSNTGHTGLIPSQGTKEKAMATYSSVLAWRIPGMGAWWAAICGVAQSRTRLTGLSSSSRELRSHLLWGN